jgi:hypothetical protein
MAMLSSPVAALTSEAPRTVPQASPDDSVVRDKISDDSFRTEVLWAGLDEMAREMGEPLSNPVLVMAVTSGLVASAGYVIWTARGGYLLASLLAATPLWREFDPLSILELHEARHRHGSSGRMHRRDDEQETLHSLLARGGRARSRAQRREGARA